MFFLAVTRKSYLKVVQSREGGGGGGGGGGGELKPLFDNVEEEGAFYQDDFPMCIA